MAEDLEKRSGLYTFSRNLKKATMRNTVQGDSLQKNLKFIQGQRKKLAHSWEERKESFLRRKFSKLPVIRRSEEDMEKEDPKDGIYDEMSRTNVNSARFSRADKTALDHRGSVSSQQFINSSHHENKELCNVPLGNSKANMSCVPKLTVKDLSRILCPDQRLPANIFSDAKETQSRTVSPSTPSKLHHRFNNFVISTEPTIRNSSSCFAYSPRTQMQQRVNFRSFPLSPNEPLDQTRDSKITPASPSIQLRKRAASHPRQNNLTSVSNQNSDIASRTLKQV